jgi:hypothetical protein
MVTDKSNQLYAKVAEDNRVINSIQQSNLIADARTTIKKIEY